MRSFELVGSVPALGVVNTLQILGAHRAEVEGFSWVASHPNFNIEGAASREMQEGSATTSIPTSRKRLEKSLVVVAGVGKEMKFGRWVEKRGEGVLNGALVVAVHPRTLVKS